LARSYGPDLVLEASEEPNLEESMYRELVITKPNLAVI